ncbi:type 4 prepilin-like proteins leader peptide-processing enzyme [Abditibacteriota bacterium]|nr:type 4 prepilin-like proteins leader peptide-processing enzyme [Abditibacteriota bacterium]
MILLLLFVLGTIVGSFLNVCIYRLPRHESVAYPPSHCPNCNTRLRGLDMVPILSQVVLGSKCRYCGQKFSWRYAGIEFLTGMLFLLAGTQYAKISGGFAAPFEGDPGRLLRDLVFMATLVVIFWVDFDTRLVQLEATLLLGLSAVAYNVWQIHNEGLASIQTDGGLFAALLPAPLPESLLAGVIAATILWILRAVFSQLYGREAMGLGDVFIVAAIAMHLGWHATLITFFFLAAVLGAVIGSLFQIPRTVRAYKWSKRRTEKYKTRRIACAMARHSFRKSLMPFGPMLAIGAVAALLYGQQINDYYIALYTPPASGPLPPAVIAVPLPTSAPSVVVPTQ